MKQVNEKVTFTDEDGVSHSATVTKVFFPDEPKSAINLSYVDEDGKTVNKTQVKHKTAEPAPKSHWH